MTEEELTTFDIIQHGERPYNFFGQEDVHLSISYQMNLSQIVINREVYTILDWFGNLGGLNEGLKLFFYMIVSILNYNYYNNYMVTKLYDQSVSSGMSLSE